MNDAPEEMEKLSWELAHLQDLFEQVFELVEGEDSQGTFRGSFYPL